MFLVLGIILVSIGIILVRATSLGHGTICVDDVIVIIVAAVQVIGIITVSFRVDGGILVVIVYAVSVVVVVVQLLAAAAVVVVVVVVVVAFHVVRVIAC